MGAKKEQRKRPKLGRVKPLAEGWEYGSPLRDHRGPLERRETPRAPLERVSVKPRTKRS